MAFTLTLIKIAIKFRKATEKISNVIPGKGLGELRLLPLFFCLGSLLQFKAFRIADQEEINFSNSVTLNTCAQ